MAEIIRLEKLSKIFQDKRNTTVAIKDIDLVIEQGDIYGIIGLSGAGKSTLIRCINLLEKPTSGAVFFEGTNLVELKDSQLRQTRQKIGMIFQNFNLMEQRTVLRNVLFPLEIAHIAKDTAKERAVELLNLVGLSDKLDSYPSQLSGGQKQRVAIARALANNPSVLLCDEATSALDPSTTLSILQLLKEINQKLGITIVIITHEMKVVETICNKVAIIDESVIKETGLVAEVFANPQTPIAKNLIYPKLGVINKEFGSVLLKLTFDKTVLEPVVADMILKTQVAVNIIEASIKQGDNGSTGEMIIQLPNDQNSIAKVQNYLTTKNISFQQSNTEVQQ